jgi:hypothetical protein
MRNSWVMDHPIRTLTLANSGWQEKGRRCRSSWHLTVANKTSSSDCSTRSEPLPGAESFVDPSRLTVILEEADPEFDDPVAIGGISGQGAPRTRSKPHMGNGSSGE